MNCVNRYTSYNHDLLIRDCAKFVYVKCRKLPNFLTKYKSEQAYLVGTRALLQFSNQFNFNQSLSSTIAKVSPNAAFEFDILFKFKSIEHTFIKLIEVGYKTVKLRDIYNGKRVFNIEIIEGELKYKVNYIFLYEEPEHIFFCFASNLLCLYLDIETEQFILSTQFLEYVQLKKVKILYEIIEDPITPTVAVAAPIKYKFRKTVYKLIIYLRIFNYIKTIRKYNKVICELNTLCCCSTRPSSNLKPVLRDIYGCQYNDLMREKYRVNYLFVLTEINELFISDPRDEIEDDVDFKLNPALRIIYGLRRRELLQRIKQNSKLRRYTFTD